MPAKHFYCTKWLALLRDEILNMPMTYIIYLSDYKGLAIRKDF